ncbi:Mut7-C RNAse domain-containing protein [Infirmifilum sp. NZ]|uniref:Mut7-C RNAse domain-containing protein n=1 Tax=Infirmifilum sp. NZ TaxID=2926850 RepID=UPI0027A9CA4D|nr:Mut7-C RNAse domain-containing protein [Infirmifilum sp. NZ]UNQ72805.1 hypothetical protein MOV14_06725 [Infirmifilum sp. NZ]
MEVLVDGMLGKLARWLRLLGVKALFYPNAEDSELESALEENPRMLLLTRDKALYSRLSRRGFKVLLVPQGRDEDVLAHVLSALGVEPAFKPDKALCSICASPLLRVPREAVAGRVPEKVFQTYSEFYVCTGCGQVYWLGTHIREMEKVLERVRCIQYGKALC